jgi:hypothetical protein
MLTAEKLREILTYDARTGVFRWKLNRGGRGKEGVVAGSKWVVTSGRVYRQIGIDGRQYAAHRLAWLYMTGEWPVEQVDHIDGDGTNNGFYNLRQATNAENACNRQAQTNNTSGYKGVTWCKSTRKWKAQIKLGGRNKNLGRFESPQDAHSAYKAASEKLHGEFARAA